MFYSEIAEEKNHSGVKLELWVSLSTHTDTSLALSRAVRGAGSQHPAPPYFSSPTPPANSSLCPHVIFLSFLLSGRQGKSILRHEFKCPTCTHPFLFC